MYAIELDKVTKKYKDVTAVDSLSFKVEKGKCVSILGVNGAGKLSGGYQRRLSIAMAIVTEPEVLFLDEPTLGLDVIARRELLRFIEKLKGRHTVVLTTHYLEEASILSDVTAVMAKGRLKAFGTTDEIIKMSGKETFEEAFIALAGGEDLK